MFIFFVIFWGWRAYSLRKFQDQGLNPHHSCDPSCSSDDSRSLTCCVTRELPNFIFLKDETGTSHRGSVETNLTSIHETAGSIPGQNNRLGIWCRCSCGIGRSFGLDWISGPGTSICLECWGKKNKTYIGIFWAEC